VRLSLVISTLTCGGAERVMSLLANEWVRRGNAVQLVTLDREPPFFPLDSRIELVQLGREKPSPTKFHALWNLYRSVGALRRTFRGFGPDGVVAFTTRVNVKALMAAPRGVPVVISERVDPSGNPLTGFWEKLTTRWYPRARRLVVQTKSIADYYAALGLSRLEVIANPVEALPGSAGGNPTGDLLWLVVARLHHQKGIDLLLQAWARSAQGKTSRLRILGDGPERGELEALAASLGVSGRVEFAGFVSDKLPHWKQASAFVLSSRYEGFPNALCEGMAAGLACVSFDCPSGPGELIRDGENGLLVPAEDVEGLASAMDRVAADPELRERLGREAVKISLTLGVAGIVDRWEGALLP
jgi:glycosyltransferase involved in cell wall biosynthesis